MTARLRDIIDLWSRGNPAAAHGPRDEVRTSEEPPALFRDAKGRVFVRAKPSSVERLTWPEDVPEAEPPTQCAGIPAEQWIALGWSPAALRWPAGTVAHITGPRVLGLTMARWLARRLQGRPDCSPVRHLSARDLAGTWAQGSDPERTVLGPEQTVILADVMTHIGRPRLARVAELLASRGRRSVVVVGDAIGVGDEWAAIDRWMKADGARRVGL